MSLQAPLPARRAGLPQRIQARRTVAWARVCVALIITAMAALLGRVVQLKIAGGQRLAEAAGSATSSHSELGHRGDLVDRRGRGIASSTIGYRLFVDPQSVDDLQTIALDLAKLIGGDAVQIDQQIAKSPDSRFVVIKPLLNDGEVDAVRRAGLRGVGLQPHQVRSDTHPAIASLLAGKVGFEHTGMSGFEHIFDRDLSTTDGHITYLRDVSRQGLWIQPSGYQPAIDGKTVQLSIDLVIQEYVDRRLREAVKANNAGGGRVVVVDCVTGEILAMCDVLNPRKGWDEAATDDARLIDPALGRNRCVTDPYEPGSTMKPFIWSVATELGRARPDETLPTPTDTGWRTSTGRLIRDAHYYGPSSWRMVLIKSMNAGMAIVAERMTAAEMQGAVSRFGFGRKTASGFEGESPGIVTTPKKWSSFTQVSVSFGHEIGVTTLQMARAFCVFARDGTLPTLRMTRDRTETRFQVEQRVLKPETVRLTREVLRDVMLQGTGRESQSTKYQLFGKTGTPQLPKKNGKGYYDDRYIATFVAGAPYEHPRVVVLCVIEDPDRHIAHYGGMVAGPVVRDIVDETLMYLGVPPDFPQDQAPAMALAH